MKDYHYQTIEEILKSTSCSLSIERGIANPPACFDVTNDKLILDYNYFFEKSSYSDLSLLIILFHEWGHAVEYFSASDKQDYLHKCITEGGTVNAEKFAFEFSIQQAKKYARKVGSNDILDQLVKNFDARLINCSPNSGHNIALIEVMKSKDYLDISNK